MSNMMANTVTVGGKVVDTNTIMVDGIDWRDYPDFCDAFVSAAKFQDGTPLTEDECYALLDTHGDFIYSNIIEKAY